MRVSNRRRANATALALAVTGLLASVGCRGILGIEDPEHRPDVDAGSGGSSSGGGRSAGGSSNGGLGGVAGGFEGGLGGTNADGGADAGTGAGGTNDVPDGSSPAGGTDAGSPPVEGGTDGGTLAVSVNEVESNGGTPGDWVELYNSGSTPADLSGFVLSDSDDSNRYALPEGTTVAPHGFLVLDEAAFGFGLGSSDAARLFRPDGTTLVSSFTWAAHAATTYGACPDGSGSLVTTTAPTKGTANDCTAHVLLNEIESNGGNPGDWVELVNASLTSLDVSGYVLRDGDPTHGFTLPAGSILPPGRFLVVEEAALGFALGAADTVRLFSTDGTTLIDAYAWTAHATTTYGRCPSGGPFVTTTSSTKGAPNDCGAATDLAPWPGTPVSAPVDDANALGDNVSGLSYEPGVTAPADVLWAIRNDPSTLYRLKNDGTVWASDTTNGWAAGKRLLYPNGKGDPDAEGVTRGDLASPDVFASAERDNDASQVSRNSVLRFDTSDTKVSLTATSEWNLTADLPVADPNRGLEGVAWLPDATLVAAGFVDERLTKAYDPTDYPGHGAGLFVVGLESDGNLYVYALSGTGGTFLRVATVVTGAVTLNDLEFDRDVGYLYTYCGIACANVATVFDVDRGVGSPTRGKFVALKRYQAPASLATFANEGIAVAPETRCAGGRKPFFLADDEATGGHAIRSTTIACGAFAP